MTDTDATGTQTIGFCTLAEEVTRDDLAIEGRLPDWLIGELVRVTPAGLDSNGHSVRHWFDGLAMLHKFSFHDGRVSYANRHLDTEARRRAADPGARQSQGFATDPCRGLFKRVMTMVSRVPSDNTNVNLVRLGREYLAMTETPMPVQFDPKTLATLGLGEAAPGQVTTAHPQVDPDERELINYATHFGRSSSYRVYTRRAGEPYQVLGQIPVAEPSYVQSDASAWLDQLVKADVETGQVSIWRAPGQYPGEPVFVAAPDADGEDTGVLLSVVLDGDRNTSFLLVLGATTFTELARAQAPHVVPFGFHGQYFT